MEKQNNKLIAVSYQLYTVGEGGDELVEVASESKPFEFISGFGTTLPRFEEEIVKLEKSATFDFQLTKDEAYGDIDEDLFIGFPKSEFIDETGVEDMPEEGDIVPMEDEDGIIMNAVVNEITDDHVILDFNPIYAGEDLYFIGKVVDVRNAK